MVTFVLDSIKPFRAHGLFLLSYRLQMIDRKLDSATLLISDAIGVLYTYVNTRSCSLTLQYIPLEKKPYVLSIYIPLRQVSVPTSLQVVSF